MTSVTPPPPSSSSSNNSCCELCCEETTTSLFELSTSCGHAACQVCWTKWIEKQELNGVETVPWCPFCRVPISSDDIQSIMGRPFQPKNQQRHAATAGNETTNVDDILVMDELTRDWLAQHTRQCPNCQLHIEKRAGCNKMECLCGFRFCFQCGAPNATCMCNPTDHLFWDNIRGHSSHISETVHVVVSSAGGGDGAADDDDNNMITVGNMVERRRKLEDRLVKQKLRENRRTLVAAEAHAMETLPRVDVSIFNGSWLFEPSDSVRYLKTIMDIPHRQRRKKGPSRRIRKVVEEPDQPKLVELRPIWPTTSMAASAITINNNYYYYAHTSVYHVRNPMATGVWLFPTKTASGSIRILGQLLRGPDIRSERHAKWLRTEWEVDIAWTVKDMDRNQPEKADQAPAAPTAASVALGGDWLYSMEDRCMAADSAWKNEIAFQPFGPAPARSPRNQQQ
jgi:hypothetical protein